MQGWYEKAEPLFQRALDITEKSFGENHPYVAASFNNLAALYYAQKKYSKAATMFEQAISIMQKRFPTGHPDIDLYQANYDELKRSMTATSVSQNIPLNIE
ncbi:MAG: tetratricopeptide repeat protein [Candidatus Electrothrix sp. YB6]